MILWFHELSATLSEGICISVLMSISKKGLRPASQRSVVMYSSPPPPSLLHPFPSLRRGSLMQNLATARFYLRSSTLKIISTHICGRLSFGPIVSKRSNAIQKEARLRGEGRGQGNGDVLRIQHKGPSQILSVTVVMNGT